MLHLCYNSPSGSGRKAQRPRAQREKVSGERVQTDHKTQQSGDDSLLTAVVQALEQAVVAVDLNGCVVFWNGFAESLYGWPAAEAMGRNLSDLLPVVQESESVGLWTDRLRSGEGFAGEYVLRRRDGRLQPVLLTSTPLRDASGTLI